MSNGVTSTAHIPSLSSQTGRVSLLMTLPGYAGLNIGRLADRLLIFGTLATIQAAYDADRVPRFANQTAKI
jgi:hypothetical protein